jgi:hypothetical protein
MSTYTVRPGDTLTSIAAQHKESLQQIEKANPQVQNPNVIDVGEKLKVKAPSAHKPHGKTHPAKTNRPQRHASPLKVAQTFEPYASKYRQQLGKPTGALKHDAFGHPMQVFQKGYIIRNGHDVYVRKLDNQQVAHVHEASVAVQFRGAAAQYQKQLGRPVGPLQHDAWGHPKQVFQKGYILSDGQHTYIRKLNNQPIATVKVPPASKSGPSKRTITTDVQSLIAQHPDGSYGGECSGFSAELAGISGFPQPGTGWGPCDGKAMVGYLSSTGRYHQVGSPQPGDIFSCSWGDHGHTGMIVSVHGNTATVLDSNWNEDHVVHVHDIPLADFSGFARHN